MATTQEILEAAQNLGKLIASHEAAGKVEAAARKLQGDVDAMRILNDYNRHLEKVSEKEASGKPVEVEDKRQLEKLQTAVVRNAVLRDFQVAQMDYLDLMRRVDEAMQGGEPAAAAAPPPGGGALGGKPGLKLS